MPLSIAFVLGTRPEIIKLAPVIRECERTDVSISIIHTGQHYSERLDATFFDQLELPYPDDNLAVGSGPQGQQTGRMIEGIEGLLQTQEPGVVLVQGDTNSTLAGAIAACKLPPTLGHVEAGLRSYDRRMPEEVNRTLVDHAADELFAPTKTAVEILTSEGIDQGKIHLTGNTIVDAVYEHRELAIERSTILAELGLVPGEFGLTTVHRAENVDDRDRFASILRGIQKAAEDLDVPFIYPIHPRAKRRIDEFDLEVPDAIETVDPLDYLDFLRLEDSASIVLTDSGGVQEEACIMQTPCVTMRENTERPETLHVGANQLSGFDPDEIRSAAGEMIERTGWENPFGDGDASSRILNVLGEPT